MAHTPVNEIVAARRPRRADARRNYDALLLAAREAFAAHGADASLEDIARRAGVGIGTLYRNFPSRTELFEAVYADEVHALCRLADEVAAEPPGKHSPHGCAASSTTWPPNARSAMQWTHNQPCSPPAAPPCTKQAPPPHPCPDSRRGAHRHHLRRPDPHGRRNHRSDLPRAGPTRPHPQHRPGRRPRPPTLTKPTPTPTRPCTRPISSPSRPRRSPHRTRTPVARSETLAA